jgi:nucleoside-diphosphate-sugar epimerase
MRIVVVGASGNVGFALARRLAPEPGVHLVGVARRVPRAGTVPITEWRARDVARDDLEDVFRGADAVVHLAWEIQPSHDLSQLIRTNITGSERVFEAVARSGVPALVYASSVGTYSRGPKDRRVDESWPREGIQSSFYSRHKAEVERQLDRFEREQPDVRVVRLRPGLIFSREAASEIRRLFVGPLFPASLAHPSLVPFVPKLPGLAFQCLHSADVADAYARAVLGDARGAFNVAAEPVLDVDRLAGLLQARTLAVPVAPVRALVSATWHARLQPMPPGWVDLGLGVPLMDCTRIERELGWSASRTAEATLLELLDGLRRGEGVETPPLEPTGEPAAAGPRP